MGATPSLLAGSQAGSAAASPRLSPRLSSRPGFVSTPSEELLRNAADQQGGWSLTKSARTLGAMYRKANSDRSLDCNDRPDSKGSDTASTDVERADEAVEQAARDRAAMANFALEKVGNRGLHTVLKLKAKASKLHGRASLRKYSLAADCAAGVRLLAQQRTLEAAEAAMASSEEDKDMSLLRNAWHLVSSTRKYFTGARGMSQVSIFANHNGQVVVAATKPAAHSLYGAIHFMEKDLPTVHEGDESEGRTPDDREQLAKPPFLKRGTQDWLLKGGNLTIKPVLARSGRSKNLIVEDEEEEEPERMDLVLLGVETEPAASLLPASVFADLTQRAVAGWRPTVSEKDFEVAQAKQALEFAELHDELHNDVLQASKQADHNSQNHILIQEQVNKLHELHLLDAASLHALSGSSLSGSPTDQHANSAPAAPLSTSAGRTPKDKRKAALPKRSPAQPSPAAPTPAPKGAPAPSKNGKTSPPKSGPALKPKPS
ncbi:hypothetical protein M885DRAFT_532944 [Pelagophyceae sp. CCMP2097]|nr:hypothetical protein M885DRAFT_532944 [Pelagophyceae sp. CCMP2097]|mmetsp:Transcript_27691/g.93043  ORF Transcript_27691/g.93043 Transcript_27691/m.93043 type:complete len:488 (-) Transcript_27691:129-1592(-)